MILAFIAGDFSKGGGGNLRSAPTCPWFHLKSTYRRVEGLCQSACISMSVLCPSTTMTQFLGDVWRWDGRIGWTMCQSPTSCFFRFVRRRCPNRCYREPLDEDKLRRGIFISILLQSFVVNSWLRCRISSISGRLQLPSRSSRTTHFLDAISNRVRPTDLNLLFGRGNDSQHRYEHGAEVPFSG